MIEGISAITLGTHEMARAVRFYRALGFEVLHGNEEASFTSFRAGTGYLNLIAQPAERHWSWWDASSSTSPMWTRCTIARLRRGACPPPLRAMPNGASATSISPILTATNSASRGLCGLALKRPSARLKSTGRAVALRAKAPAAS